MEAFFTQYPDLKNRSEKELEHSLNFIREYTKVYCEKQPVEAQNMYIISLAFKNGVGKAIAKRYEIASFAGSMQGSQKDRKKIQDTLFGNKKLNKQLNEILSEAGIKTKKKGFLGLFG